METVMFAIDAASRNLMFGNCRRFFLHPMDQV
jgi:hypothetical protein